MCNSWKSEDISFNRCKCVKENISAKLYTCYGPLLTLRLWRYIKNLIYISQYKISTDSFYWVSRSRSTFDNINFYSSQFRYFILTTRPLTFSIYRYDILAWRSVTWPCKTNNQSLLAATIIIILIGFYFLCTMFSSNFQNLLHFITPYISRNIIP